MFELLAKYFLFKLKQGQEQKYVPEIYGPASHQSRALTCFLSEAPSFLRT